MVSETSGLDQTQHNPPVQPKSSTQRLILQAGNVEHANRKPECWPWHPGQQEAILISPLLAACMLLYISESTSTACLLQQNLGLRANAANTAHTVGDMLQMGPLLYDAIARRAMLKNTCTTQCCQM